VGVLNLAHDGESGSWHHLVASNTPRASDRDELQWRMRTDGIDIRLGLTLRTGKTAPAADRQYIPWLNDTIAAVDRPMSVAALAIVAEQWRTRRAPYLRDTRADVRIGEPMARPPATWWWRWRHGEQPSTPT